MYWLKDLYLGESVKDKEKEIRRKLYTNAGQIRVHVLALSQSADEQIDILPAFVFQQSRFPQEELHIFGLAGGKQEAFRLIEQIAKETWANTGTADLRSYLSEGREYRFSRR